MSTRESPLYRAFGQARPTPRLPSAESQVATPPPPPPPVAKPAPPPPPPMPAAREQTSEGAYAPRDPNFFCAAKVQFYSALRPVGHADKSDRLNAETAADTLARFVDSGAVPKGFDIPEVAALKALILEKETLVTTPRPTEHFIPSVAHVKRVGEAIDARAKELGADIPSDKDELKKATEAAVQKNAAAIAGVGDLSESIRWSATWAAAQALRASPLTGSPHLLHDCLRVVYEHLDFAVRTFAAYETEPLPYPGSAAMHMVELLEDFRASLAEEQEAKRGAEMAEARSRAGIPDSREA
jgi:hypothetical protein